MSANTIDFDTNELTVVIPPSGEFPRSLSFICYGEEFRLLENGRTNTTTERSFEFQTGNKKIGDIGLTFPHNGRLTVLSLKDTHGPMRMRNPYANQEIIFAHDPAREAISIYRRSSLSRGLLEVGLLQTLQPAEIAHFLNDQSSREYKARRIPLNQTSLQDVPALHMLSHLVRDNTEPRSLASGIGDWLVGAMDEARRQLTVDKNIYRIKGPISVPELKL